MEEIGPLLARYHATSEQIRMPGQLPSALPLAQVPALLLSAPDSADIDAHHSAVIRQHAEQLARRLSDIAPMNRERAVIHGDFTNDNVIASGTPSRRPASSTSRSRSSSNRWPTSDTRYGAGDVRPSTPPAWTRVESAATYTATTASGRSRRTRQRSSPSFCSAAGCR
jgi:hypothetical protein